MTMQHEWVTIHERGWCDTQRMEVPGGWIYKHERWDLQSESGPISIAMVFVPGTGSTQRSTE